MWHPLLAAAELPLSTFSRGVAIGGNSHQLHLHHSTAAALALAISTLQVQVANIEQEDWKIQALIQIQKQAQIQNPVQDPVQLRQHLEMI